MCLNRLILSALLSAVAFLPIVDCRAHAMEDDIEAVMVKAATFFREQLSVEGSYVWKYNALDLSERWGEGITTLSQGWTEPPGTPAVGLAYLAAFKATGQQLFLDAALEAAQALVRTQLESGGWQGLLEFDPTARQSWCYRIDKGKGRPDCEAIEGNNRKNTTSPDDNKSQSSLIFLLRLDEELRESSSEVRKAVIYGLNKFLEAQYPNGAWPHRLDSSLIGKLTSSAWRARYPETWSRIYVKPVGEVYSINDHLVRDIIRMFLLAYDVYDEPAYLAASKRGGDFLLSAQMPEPQPGWAQMYNGDLEPIWGRPFEPPSIASNETAGSIQALLELYDVTGETRYLDGAALAIRWLEQSRMSEDNWARFYELESNKPLYVDVDYQITYRDDNLPDHYRFAGHFGIKRVLKRYRQVTHDGDGPSGRDQTCPVPKKTRVVEFIEALDAEGRWLDGDMIDSGVFIKRLSGLACFLAAEKGEALPDYLEAVKHQLDR